MTRLNTVMIQIGEVDAGLMPWPKARAEQKAMLEKLADEGCETIRARHPVTDRVLLKCEPKI